MKFYKTIYWLMMQSRWYQFWSRLYRFGQRKYKKVFSKFEQYTDPVALQTELDKIEYHKDTWKQLWDVCHSPHYSRYVLASARENEQSDEAFDCDDYACLAIHMLDWHFNAHLLGVSYKRKNKRFNFGGHMVCYFETPFGFRHMGNWGLSTNYRSLEAMAKDIAYRADSELIGYTILDKNLKIVKVHT